VNRDWEFYYGEVFGEKRYWVEFKRKLIGYVLGEWEFFRVTLGV